MSYQAPSLSEYVNLGQSMRRGADSRRDQERQKLLDAQNDELHRARMDEINAGRAQRISLADAAAPAQVDTGTQITDTAGSDAFTKDPDAAAMMGDMAAAKGAQPALASATRVNKQVFTDPAKAGKAADEYNSTDAVTQRQVKALQTTDPAKAITLANAAAVQRKGQRAESDDAIDRGIYGSHDPQGLADFMSKTLTGQMGADVKAEYVPSPDGKSWVLGINVGGERKPLGQFTNDAAGLRQAQELVFSRMGSPEARRNMEKFKSDRELQKAIAAETARRNLVMEDAAIRNAKANETRAGAAEKAATGSGAAGGRIQKTSVDSEGYMIGIFRDGTSKRLENSDGNPIRADSAEKRVDALTKHLMENSREHRRKPYSEVRKDAEEILRGSQATSNPADGSAQPKRITSAAERDALPKGTRYVAPNGTTYIKQ